MTLGISLLFCLFPEYVKKSVKHLIERRVFVIKEAEKFQAT
jgi:hypothetical protein